MVLYLSVPGTESLFRYYPIDVGRMWGNIPLRFVEALAEEMPYENEFF